jgi:hypothetical protein
MLSHAAHRSGVLQASVLFSYKRLIERQVRVLAQAQSCVKVLRCSGLGGCQLDGSTAAFATISWLVSADYLQGVLDTTVCCMLC